MAKRLQLQRIPLIEMLFPKRPTEAGAPPGEIHADPAALPTRIEIVAYGPGGIAREAEVTVAEARAAVGQQAVTWIQLTGLADVAAIQELGKAFDIHRLALEDMVNVHQRPKFEEYPQQDLIIMRIPSPEADRVTDQLAIILGDGYVISAFERPLAFTEAIAERIRQQRPRLVKGGADYLAYALLDASIDSFYPVLEAFGDRLEDSEDQILASRNSDSHIIQSIHASKRRLSLLHRVLRQSRQALESMIGEEVPIISDSTRIHLRDCHDHSNQLIALVETLQEGFAGLIDFQLSLSGQRLNEVMRVLTIIATIFIPLSFVAGVYGMNFDTQSRWNMPELSWRFGYPFALGLMLAVVLGMLIFFRRRGWLGATRKKD